jgi:dTDP-4-amino-4,6-dideoxygalactose transaminase
LDLKAQHHQIYNEIDDRITDTITNTGFILGKHVEEFEQGFAELQEAKYCIGVSSGTDALHIALMALDIGPGDVVIVPVNTFIATAEAVSLTGSTPVFVDCDNFYNLDVKELRKVIESRQYAVNSKQRKGRITNNESRITCILPVHLYGQPANMDEIMDLATEYELKVVEDACQAHLARYDGKLVGNFGEFGAFSFYPGKNLGAYGEAGALITNNEELYLMAKMLRQHGEITRYHHSVIGHNYRMEAIQGAVLATKLKYLDEWTKKRQKNAQLYNELLNGVKGIQTPVEVDNAFCVYHLYVIQVDDRDGLQRYLQQNGISTGLHYPVPLHLQEAYKELGYKKGDFPVAERAAKRILSLPMFPELTEAQIRYVCWKIVEWING